MQYQDGDSLIYKNESKEVNASESAESAIKSRTTETPASSSAESAETLPREKMQLSMVFFIINLLYSYAG